MKIGLALSGGGVRATVFHLGLLRYLAETTRWPEITFISTVSGGSLCVGLVFEKAGQKWPSAEDFTRVCLPEIKSLLTQFDLEATYKKSLLFRPWLLLGGRAHVLAELMRSHWGITGNVNLMPDSPRWEICTTCYETGKSWRFSKKRMGDYVANYVINPEFPLADALAASAAVPGLIGPLRFSTNKYKWHKFADKKNQATIPVPPSFEYITLWDGGVYENLGIETLFKLSGAFGGNKGLREEIDFLIVSDASKPLGTEVKRLQMKLPFYVPPFRLIDIATDQVRSVRVRGFVEFLRSNPKAGAVLRMGKSIESIFQDVEKSLPSAWQNLKFLGESEVNAAAGLETTLRNLSIEEFDLLCQHGYEIAKGVFSAYGHAEFVV